MEYAVAASLNAIQYFTMVQFFDAFFLRKYSGWKFWSLVLVWAAAFFSLVTFLTSPAMSWQKVVLVPVMTFVLALGLYQGDLPAKIFLSIMSYALFNAVCYGAVFLSMLLFRASYEQLLEDRLLYIITGVTGALCALFVAQLIKHFHPPRCSEQKQGAMGAYNGHFSAFLHSDSLPALFGRNAFGGRLDGQKFLCCDRNYCAGIFQYYHHVPR